MDLDTKHIPLFHAIKQGVCGIVEMLLRAGADPNIWGTTTKSKRLVNPLAWAIHWAAAEIHYDIVDTLLQYGADPETDIFLDNCKISVMRLGILNRNVKFCQILLQNGANPDKHVTAGHTPLFRACMVLNNELVNIFIRFNADLEIPCNEGVKCVTPFEYIQEWCFSWIKSPGLRPRQFGLMAMRIARILATAGAVLHKYEIYSVPDSVLHTAPALATTGDAEPKVTSTVRSVMALCGKWTWMENKVRQSKWMFNEEEKQEVIDFIQLIKHKLTHPAHLTGICRLRIRRALRPGFHKRLACLQLPKSTKNYIAMKDILPLDDDDAEDRDHNDYGNFWWYIYINIIVFQISWQIYQSYLVFRRFFFA